MRRHYWRQQCRQQWRHLPGKASVLKMIDYYNLLGIPPEASQEQIKKAFRRLAKQVHPDTNPGGTAKEREVLRRKFIQLAQAYDVLSDPARRERYRREWRAQGRRASGKDGPSARSTSSGAAGPFRSSGAAFGGARRPDGDSQQRKNPDVEPGFELPHDLLGEVKNLLAEFGLDLRQPLEKLLERLTAWARDIFQEVTGEKEQAPAREPPRPEPRKRKSKEQKSAGAGKAGAGKAGAATNQKHGGTDPELDAELAALKKRARKGKARKARKPSGEEETEEELRRLKASAASRKSRRE